VERLLNATLNVIRQYGEELFIDVSRPYAYTMVVRHEDKKIFLKLARDVDEVSNSAIRDMKLLSDFLKASAIGVISAAHGEVLEEGVVYRKSGMNFVSLATLAKAFRGEMPRFIRSKGKRYAIIDGEEFRRSRERLGLSLNEVSRMLSVSRETLYRYEKGEYSVPERAARIIMKMDGSIIKGIDIFRTVKADEMDMASRAIDVNKYRLEESHPDGIIYGNETKLLVRDKERREKAELLGQIFGVTVVEE
jgi:putative transcriptional regulator